jgi:hypothetical protein
MAEERESNQESIWPRQNSESAGGDAKACFPNAIQIEGREDEEDID